MGEPGRSVNRVTAMGRKKSYDREKLVREAMEIFRDHGFAGTSAEMLVERLGVNRYSLYAEFGSKQGLFDAALERYDEEVIQRNFGPLEAPGAGIDEIRAVFDRHGVRLTTATGLRARRSHWLNLANLAADEAGRVSVERTRKTELSKRCRDTIDDRKAQTEAVPEYPPEP